MSYDVPSEFPALPTLGTSAWAPREILGGDAEPEVLVGAQHYLWGYGCRRRLLCQRHLQPPTVVGGPTQILETTGEVQAGRTSHGGGRPELYAYLDYEGGTVTVEVYDTGGSLLASATSSASTPRAQATLSLSGVTATSVVVKVLLTQVGGSGAKLHGVQVYEAPILAADLAVVGDFVPRDASVVDAGRSWNARETEAAYVNLSECNQRRTPSCACALHLDRPINLASLEERVLEFVVPLYPELRYLRWTLGHKISQAAVSLRWSLVWAGGSSEPTDWTSYATTGGSYTTETDVLDLYPALRAGVEVCVVRLHVLSALDTASKTIGAFAGTPALDRLGVTLSSNVTTLFPGVDALFAAMIEFESALGSSLPTAQRLELLRYSGAEVIWYPALDSDEATTLAATAGRVQITPLGRLDLRSLELEWQHGTPYQGAPPRFPWEDPDTARLALTSARGLSAQAHQQLYGAAALLASSRAPVLGVGWLPWQYPTSGGYAQLRVQGYIQLAWTSGLTGWSDLAAWVFDTPDQVEYLGDILTRRALTVGALLFATGQRIGSFALEVRLLWRTEGGTTRATGEASSLTLPVEGERWSYSQQVFALQRLVASGASVIEFGPKAVNTLQPLMPPLSASLLHRLVRLTLADVDAGHSAGGVLALQVRPAQTLQQADFGASGSVWIYHQSSYCQPLRGAGLLDVAV